MEFDPIDMHGFEGREKELAKIERFHHHTTPVMIYRTNNLIHSYRVLWLLENALQDILSVYGEDFDVKFARTLALVHDDLEMITGDVQLHDKENMKDYEMEELKKNEENAIPILKKRYYHEVNGYDYGRLLEAAMNKDCLEAQFVSLFDKLDAFGEACHEIWAGNHHFLLPAGGYHGQEGGYVERVKDFINKYPRMEEFFRKFPEYLPPAYDFRSEADKGELHTEESIRSESGYQPYDRWKRIILNKEGSYNLITPKESLEKQLSKA